MTDQNTRLTDAARSLRSLNDEITAAEMALERLNDSRLTLERTTLPELFTEAGITSLTLEDGSILKLSMMAEGTLPKDPAKRKAAVDWLVENGYEDLIENKVTASFSRGDRESAQAEFERLKALGNAKVDLNETMHYKTLGARMRDRVVAGQPTPLETLGVTVFERARFTKTTRNNHDE